MRRCKLQMCVWGGRKGGGEGWGVRREGEWEKGGMVCVCREGEWEGKFVDR